MHDKAIFDVPVRSPWSFSGLRVLLFGALIPMVLIAAAVVWAVSRPVGGDSPKIASAEALDCASSRDAWRWACQQDKLGRETQPATAPKRDVLTTGSIGRAATTAAEPARGNAPAKVASAEPKPAPTAAAPAKPGPVEAKPAPAPVAKVAAVDAKPPIEVKAVPEVPAVKMEPARDAAKPIEPARPAKAPAPPVKQVTAAAPAGPAATAPAKGDDVVAEIPPPASPPTTAWADPAPKASAVPEASLNTAPGELAAAAAPTPPAPEPRLAAMQQPAAAETKTSAVAPEERSAAAPTSAPARASTASREPRAAPEHRAAGARPAPKVEKPVRIARHRPAPARREASVAVEREEAAVVPRAPNSLRLRAAHAKTPGGQSGVVPALRVTSTATYSLPDGRVVTVNVAPSSQVVRDLVQRHTQAYASPRASRPYWDW